MDKASSDGLRSPWLAADESAREASSTGTRRWSVLHRSTLWRPPTDVFETDEAYEVVVEVAGMRGSEIAVRYEQHVLTIHGRRPEVPGAKAYYQMEIAFGEFLTEVRIPGPVDSSGIRANYSDGFLRVSLPKTRPTSIEVT